MQVKRIVEDEIYAVIRNNGYSSIEEIDAVVFETSGTFTVIKNVKISKAKR